MKSSQLNMADVEDFGPVESKHDLDPNAPAFVPDAKPIPSLVFSKGNRFLTKYDEKGTRGPDSGPALRSDHGVGDGSNGNYGGSNRVARPGPEPERLNIQLNSLLVRSRSVDRILQVVDANFNHFNVVNVVTALHRMATVVIPARKAMLRRDLRFKRLINKLSEMLRQSTSQPESYLLKPQDLSNIAWALTKLGLINEGLFSILSDYIIRTIGEFEPVNLSMTLWAYARSNLIHEKLFNAAIPEVSKKLHEFEPQQLANTTWAMAKSGFVNEDVFHRAAKLSLDKIHEFKPMNFSMLVYSFALAKIPQQELFDAVSKCCTVKELSSSSSSPHVVSNIAWAYAESDSGDGGLWKTIAMVSSPNIHDFTMQQVLMLAGAYAKAGVRDERLFGSISDAVVQRLSEFKQSEIQELLRAFAKLDLSTTSITRAIEETHNDGRQGGVYASLGLVGFFVLVVAFIVAMKSYAWPSLTDQPSTKPPS